ncbi:glycerol-3-phosphate dehydrogenase [Derxia gummosa]|uniref:Glycerol-3-phosphate dehydrogenase n=1 Tax=Derxia gummosa DSM 723 TaxID=1121388 RepID=A0A8B6X9T9_9BURK|nr:glycerol-3-phosphate dehydrogenase [Derxia gummosa]
MSETKDCDLLVVGGGINGAGIARDAAGRGLSVVLCEQHDLAAHTSSSSSKLIHGGLRYLEYYEFGLVRKALQERELLLRAAPHIIWPMRFVMPHRPHLRPAWLIRTGLFLYDHLARRELLPGSESITMARHPAGAPLDASIKRGFVYSDGWVDDARLVVLNAMDAAERGAAILPRTRLEGARRDGDRWLARLRRADDGAEITVRARGLVNAAGPWAGSLLEHQLRRPAANRVRLVKGSHIVTRRLFDHDHAYILQNPDKRIVFVIPYERDFTLIGTTDVEYEGDPAQVGISAAETDYLCRAVNANFRQQISPADVVWSYAGVRPLLEQEGASASAVTRDYQLELDAPAGAAPLLNIFGGKITTYRKLAEEATDRMAAALGVAGSAAAQGRTGSGVAIGQAAAADAPAGASVAARSGWTATAPLPGGDLPGADFGAFLARLRRDHPWLPERMALRLAHSYGSRVTRVLGDARCLDDLGAEISPGLREAELRHLTAEEWARTADDILWRRSKLGLHATPASKAALEDWLARHLSSQPPSPMPAPQPA